MARRKTSRQIAASKRNIKKAQAASARKRRNGGVNKKRVIGAVVYGVGMGALGYAAVRSHKEAKYAKASYKIRHQPGRHFNHRGGRTTAVPPRMRYTLGKGRKSFETNLRRLVGSEFHKRGMRTNSEIRAGRNRR